jgi:glycosyltransferase involved in cell wall biosynthesis
MEYLGTGKAVNSIKPIVSVSVATYNQTHFIKECLEGILMQDTDFPFEIIIGEDESADGTREICRKYAEKHQDKIRLFLRSRKDVIYVNGNATGRFNFMQNLKACRGKFIALCEGDDYWIDSLKLQKQIEFLQSNPDYSICFHNAKVIGDRKPEGVALYSDFPWSRIETDRAEYSIADVLVSPLMPTASVVMKNDFTKEFPGWFKRTMSADMALFILSVGTRKIRLLDGVMSVYRKHSGGITIHHGNDEIHLNRIYMYKKIKESHGDEFGVLIDAKIKEHISSLKSIMNKARAYWLLFGS